tara:strand:+ start:329 stop:640 length:312 start_codon:yes stop_codon:yes gene_type:complete
MAESSHTVQHQTKRREKMTQTENNTNHYNATSNPKPDRIAKIRKGSGKGATFETVGVAWTRKDGSMYFKPYGKQVIDQPIYLFDTTSNEQNDPTQAQSQVMPE